jgi:multidrug resistance efflux pump
MLRLDRPEPVATARERRIFFIYGALAATYITLTLTLFAAFVLGWATVRFGAVGTALAAMWLVLLMQSTVLEWSRTLVLTIRTHRAAWRRRLMSRPAQALMLSVVIIGFVAPWPLTSTGTVVVSPTSTRAVTAADSGTVAEMLAEESGRVVAGAPVVRVVDYGLERECLTAAREVDSLAAAELAARAAGRVADAEALAAWGRSEQAAWRALERHAERLTLRAPISGIVVTMHPEDLVGRQVRPGDSLLILATTDTLEARIALNGAGATRVEVGDIVHLVSYADPSAAVSALVHDIGAQAVQNGDTAHAAVEARVRLVANELWRPGTTGEARVVVGRSTIFGALWWKLRQWVRADLWL